MLRRRNREGADRNPADADAIPSHSAIADAAWVAQDRVRLAAAGAPGAVAHAVRWPLERAAWTARRWLIWPIADRTGAPARALGFGAVVILAAGAGVAALVWVAPDGASNAAPQAATPSQPLAAAKPAAEPSGPTLHGAAPSFQATGGAPTPKLDSATAVESSPAHAAAAPSATDSEKVSSTASDSTAQTSTVAPGPPAGPAAISVAREFADAFVLYETGEGGADVRRAFGETATPALAHALLRRPPRLPSGVSVPRAKVLNVVAAPSHGDVYPVSVSLLRVGVTSELRLELESAKGNHWRVVNVLG